MISSHWGDWATACHWLGSLVFVDSVLAADHQIQIVELFFDSKTFCKLDKSVMKI